MIRIKVFQCTVRVNTFRVSALKDIEHFEKDGTISVGSLSVSMFLYCTSACTEIFGYAWANIERNNTVVFTKSWSSNFKLEISKEFEICSWFRANCHFFLLGAYTEKISSCCNGKLQQKDGPWSCCSCIGSGAVHRSVLQGARQLWSFYLACTMFWEESVLEDSLWSRVVNHNGTFHGKSGFDRQEPSTQFKEVEECHDEVPVTCLNDTSFFLVVHFGFQSNFKIYDLTFHSEKQTEECLKKTELYKDEGWSVLGWNGPMDQNWMFPIQNTKAITVWLHKMRKKDELWREESHWWSYCFDAGWSLFVFKFNFSSLLLAKYFKQKL